MTYCVAARLNEGMVFLSDSRTNAGMDQVSTFRKMEVFERAGDRLIVLLSAGNLAITQGVREVLNEDSDADTLWTVDSLAQAAELVGRAVRKVHARDGRAFADFGIEFNCSFILGGQIRGEACRLFNVYSAGNFIEAHSDCPYFQIGESKYGKPILDRVLGPETPIDDAVKCLLVSMDSTLRSNISVGMPLDLLAYHSGDLRTSRFVSIGDDDEYFASIRGRWSQLLREAFQALPAPDWTQAPSGRSRAIFERSIRSHDQ
jgi:putative proteasome-type protease